MKKKILSAIFLLGVMISATACGNLQNSSLSSGVNETSKSKKSVQSTNSNDKNSYNTLLQGKQYQVSPITGISNNANDNEFNIQGFEAGLLSVSKNEFSTNKFLLQEGKILKASNATKWLGRKSKSNPEGLNPEDNGSKEEDKRNPIYLSQILEDDFYQGSGDNYKLSGISIGLAMNSVDYFTKEDYGAQYETKISKEKREEMGKKYADQIVKRLRKEFKDVKNIPILVALYETKENNSLVSGNYFAYAVSKNGTNKANNWKAIDEKSQLLPTVNGEDTINASDAEAFSAFKSHVQSYFPKLSGVVSQVHYENGNLKNMSITINTQFFGIAQVKSFTQYTLEAASKYLPAGVPIEISIKSVRGTQAFIARESGQKNFYSHVFNNY